MSRLIVESVNSSSLLRRSLSPGEAETYGTFDGETLVVDDEHDSEALVERYPNVHYPENQPTQKESEPVRMEADNEGVRVVDDGPDICGEEMTDGSVCERPAGDCPYH